MSKSPYKPRRPASLKAATSELVTACGGQPVAAEVLATSKNTVFRWTDDSDDNRDRFISAHAVRLLERHCGQPIVTAFLAAEAKHVLVPLDLAVLAGDLATAVARYAQETSEAFAKLALALADKTITPAEARAAIVELDQAQGMGGALRAALREIAEGGGEA